MTTTTATRHLAAILAADVAGYSRLMEADEEGTLERLKAHLSEVVDPNIREYHGRIVKTTGDGLLAEFPSVADAVRCAGEIQRRMADRNLDVPEEQRLRFRIGINLGDIIADGDDIYGDGVNIAARLEGLAAPGGICISGTVRDQIGDRLPYAFESLGDQNVKNIARPVRAYGLRLVGNASPSALRLPMRPFRSSRPLIGALAVAALFILGTAWWFRPALQSTTPAVSAISQPLVAPRLSIVVLPFTNFSNDSDQQYLADGITEDLTTDLSRIADMFVISNNTAFTYRNKPVDTKQIGRELGVRYMLEGSVRRSGDRVRVTAQLIDADTDAHLWAERFDREIDDLLVVQDEITRQIAQELNTKLIANEAARPTKHPDALDYILRGRAEMLKPNTRKAFADAIGFFERALALDPRSVEAQIRLAEALARRALDGLSQSRAADLARAEGLVGQALAASPGSPGAHFTKGQILRAEGHFAEAIPEYETVLKFDPNDAWALFALAHCKLNAGSIEEVIPLVARAIRLSPRDPNIGLMYFRIGEIHLLQSRVGEAITWLEQARGANPEYPFIHAFLAATYGLDGDKERAASELAEARKLQGEGSYSSIARLNKQSFGLSNHALLEGTFFAGLRKAGMPEE
jgi:TolB-like protein/class 3 adenylate cyclase/Flp pilus assembly protein TadD